MFTSGASGKPAACSAYGDPHGPAGPVDLKCDIGGVKPYSQALAIS